MTKIPLVIEELHRSETKLVHDLLRLSDRHKPDHDIHHLARDLAGWSRDHVAELSRVGRRFDLDLDADAGDGDGVLSVLRQKGADLLGRRPEPALLLLADLRHLYRDASGVSLDWELLAQAAQSTKDQELLDVAERCHPETLRQARWANAMLKELSAQALVT